MLLKCCAFFENCPKMPLVHSSAEDGENMETRDNACEGLLGTSFIEQNERGTTNCHYSRTRSCCGSNKKAVFVLDNLPKAWGRILMNLLLTDTQSVETE